MKRPMILAVALAFVSIWVIVMAAGLTVAWLTDELRVFGSVMLPGAVAAVVLALYFDWRGKLRRQLLRADDRDAGTTSG